MADFLSIEQILHHVRNRLFTVYLEITLLKGILRTGFVDPRLNLPLRS